MLHDVTLSANGVTLRPLRPADARELQPHLDREMWACMSTPFPETPEKLEALFVAQIADPAIQTFAVLSGERLVGRTSLYDLNDLRCELGQTFYLREVWGTGVNSTAKALLLDYAFSTLGVMRVGLRCDQRNKRSARAIKKLGATFEGPAYKYRLDPEGQPVDMYIYSITDDKWNRLQR